MDRLINLIDHSILFCAMLTIIYGFNDKKRTPPETGATSQRQRHPRSALYCFGLLPGWILSDSDCQSLKPLVSGSSASCGYLQAFLPTSLNLNPALVFCSVRWSDSAGSSPGDPSSDGQHPSLPLAVDLFKDGFCPVCSGLVNQSISQFTISRYHDSSKNQII